MSDRSVSLNLGSEAIAALLPHREPIVMVDRVVSYIRRPRPAIEARLTIRGDEPVFAGHFPGRSIWPGAYLMEGIAQCAALLANFRANDAAGVGIQPSATPRIGLLARAQIDFFAPVVPPAELRYYVKFIGEFGALARVDGEVVVAGRCVAAGSLSVTLGTPDEELP